MAITVLPALARSTPVLAGDGSYWGLDLDCMNLVAGKVYDLAGKRGPGTVTNIASTAVVSGQVGQALTFTRASPSYITVPGILPFTSGISICAWIKLSTASSSRQGIVCSRLAIENSSGFLFTIGVTSGKMSFAIIGNATHPASNTTLSTGIWYHVACVHDTSPATTFYLNGNYDGYGTHTGAVGAGSNSSGVNHSLGCETYDNGGNALGGVLDDIRYFPRLLSQDEIGRIYLSGLRGIRNIGKWDPTISVVAAASFTPEFRRTFSRIGTRVGARQTVGWQ